MNLAQHVQISAIAIVILQCVVGSAAHAEEIDLAANKDNTLFEEGDLSNGAGDHIFAGSTANGSSRRSLIQFDIAGNIPAGATIDAVHLTLNVSKIPIGTAKNVGLFRLSRDWGESGSNAPGEEGGGTEPAADDATWSHTFFPFEFWSEPGGDYSGVASATTLVGGLGFVTWSTTPELVADVQQWLDQPAGNFGWLLMGDESEALTAKRFDSRETGGAQAPRLRILFTPAPFGACCAVNGECSESLESICRESGGFFQSPGSTCAMVLECPVFENSFEG